MTELANQHLIRLDLGCGRRKHSGAIGVDSVQLDTVDVLCDLSARPFPFASECADEVILSHVLEHFTIEEIHSILDEVYRILQVQGVVTISVPHSFSPASNSDPTHKTRFTFGTWYHFEKGHAFNYYNGTPKWKIKRLWASVNLIDNHLATVQPWVQKLESYATRLMRFLVRRSHSQTLPDLVVKQFPFWLVNIHCQLVKAD